MGQKVNPCIFRIGPNLPRNWESVLYAKNNYSDFLLKILKIRKIINQEYRLAQITKIVIEWPSNKNIIINIDAKKVGVIIGKSGSDIEKLKKKIAEITFADVSINIREIKKPEIEEVFIAQTIAQQLERRQSFKKVMKKAIQASIKQGAKGIKIICSGRLGGVEIARSESYKEGRVPLHTIRADVRYATAEAVTTYGVIGVKVWIYNGNVNESRIKEVKNNS
ncbi:ribosomal protein S3 [Orientia chuto str. Dubai]|uniref:Small ribosomal subunit protein uS3 n=1 Tax=Orientia chuto str. Dubai TaxID=1359168 RepID=A0A0F3MHX5_9RICK|nr:30S ribosomal protein S3 [Candidatus Orientia mediorientalis]KJV55261.1 ribosomal protein S3 [Orientia chuto str. Dubai]